MLDYLRFRLKLRKLEKQERKTDREKKIETAKARGVPEDEVGGLELEAAHEGFCHREKIQQLHSEYLTKRAFRLIVPIPEYGTESGMWERNAHHYAYLSEHGINCEPTSALKEGRGWSCS
jgi:hypothetical protein